MNAQPVTLSPQQAALVNWVRNGSGSAFGEAVAGAGKTITALTAAAKMKGSVAVMAYNKAAAVEFKIKAAKLGLNFDNRVRFGTCHSFGLNGWRRAYPEVQVDEKKKRDMTIARYRQIKSPEKLDAFTLKLTSLAKQRALGLFGDVDDRSEWFRIVDHFDLAYELECDDTIEGAGDGEVTVERGIELAIRTLKYHRELGPKIVDFDDMIFLPVVSGIRLWQNDWVVGDEWQDANAARRALVRKMLRPDGRALFIGDRHQAIYGFTGADNDSIDTTVREFKCKELPMTYTFRCPKAVVEEARKTVSHIQAHDTAPEGKVSVVDYSILNGNKCNGCPNQKTGPDATCCNNNPTPFKLSADDAILCRKTKPLVSLAYQLIKRGVACHVEGREIGAGLLKLIDRFAGGRAGSGKFQGLEQFRGRLTTYAEKETAKLVAKGRETQAEALNDRIETIFAIMDSQPPATTVEELRKRVAGLFTDGDNEAKKTTTLATIHKAKGREWGRVFILGRSDYMPSPWARQEWQQQQEQNLIYVAVTRAQRELVLINGVEQLK